MIHTERKQAYFTFSGVTMLADVNIDLVTAFLPDVKSMASFATASRRSKGIVYANIPAAIQSLRQKMTKYQRETLCNLGQNPGIGHLKAIAERRCIVCKKSYKGGIREPWGIPAHPDCTKGLEVNVKYVGTGIPADLMPLVRSTIPVNVRDGYSSYHGQYSYETVIPKAIPGVIPENMTLAYFRTSHANKVNAWMERIRQEKSAQQEKRKRAAAEQRNTRQKKQKVENEQRRTSIEGITNTSYLKWMRTVPKSAKKYVSKLSAEDSVAAAAIIRANVDLSEQAHVVVLKRGRELSSAYALVRKYGEQALVLLRRGYGINDARGILVSREQKAQKSSDVGNCAPSSQGTGKTCGCGSLSAMKCKYNMCAGCCPKVECRRHR